MSFVRDTRSDLYHLLCSLSYALSISVHAPPSLSIRTISLPYPLRYFPSSCVASERPLEWLPLPNLLLSGPDLVSYCKLAGVLII